MGRFPGEPYAAERLGRGRSGRSSAVARDAAQAGPAPGEEGVGAYAHLRSISDDSGSTKGALTCADIRHFKVPLPPPEEQHDILGWIRQENGALALAKVPS